jgi:ribA/ribD-fused uncharacterized protein
MSTKHPGGEGGRGDSHRSGAMNAAASPPTASEPAILEWPTGAPFQSEGPRDAPGTLYFWSGPFSSFALIKDGLHLPAGYLGHEPGEMCTAYSRESYFQACKASERETFLRILRAGPAEAKRLGGPNGIVVLREDWEYVRYAVMLAFNRRQWRLDGWRELLLMTGEQTLAERSPYDAEWGCLEKRSGRYSGRNLLGICHMHVRHELRQEIDARFAGQRRPFLRTRAQLDERT